ncbi:MAG: SUMF1/EgtB/PvdO family nonheme iron enzyme [Bacteroidota bacterium]
MQTIKKCGAIARSVSIKALLILSLVLLHRSADANNLQITGITVNQVAKTVAFNITWDNSWNIAGTGVPNNWDAVWIFIKYKDCNATSAIPFTHAVLSSVTANHTIPATLEAMTSVNWNGAAGITESAAQGVALDFTDGIMLRPKVTGTGTLPSSSVVLNIPALPGVATTLTVDIFGIEMVYVPQGDFTIGDGSGVTTANNSFLGSNVLNAASMTVTGAFETAPQTFYMNNEPAASVLTVANVPASFPKGNYGFYMMKYEITEGQYMEFLNTLGTAQQTTRAPGSFGTNRNQLQQAVLPYSTTRPDRAQNFLSWADISAYYDWSCLRPMTETEFEKACRGNGSTLGEYAWGNLVISQGATFAGAATENGTETFIAGNATYGNGTYTNGDGATGPSRVGVYATSSSTRQTAGASYFGVMDLSGNVMEYVVAINSTAASNVLTRTWGNGILDAAGQHDVAVWPVNNTAAVNFATTNLIGLRGGAWNNGVAELQVSSRYFMYTSPQSIGRGSTNGGRGLR